MAFRDHKWYRPRQIAREGLIVSPSGYSNETGNYHYVLRMIKEGHLRAQDYSAVGAKPYWIISEAEIKRFNNNQHKLIGGGNGARQSKARKQKV